MCTGIGNFLLEYSNRSHVKVKYYYSEEATETTKLLIDIAQSNRKNTRHGRSYQTILIELVMFVSTLVVVYNNVKLT